jgi:peptidoglycan/xylan/chitin deacetylase (PgdA/CDA1 family)
VSRRVADTLVLCYHAVSPTWPADLSVTPEALERQLQLLARQGYTGVTFGAAVGEPDVGRRVSVTFDDAFLSVLELAKPILDELGWPATVFAVADHVRDGWPLAWAGTERWLTTEHEQELAGMDAAQLQALAADGWEIGSHTCTHPSLPTLPPGELQEELERSKADLEAMLGLPMTSIAYPYGDHNDAVVAATEAAGYACAATLPHRWPRPERLRWPRIGVYHPDDLRRYRIKVSPAVRRARTQLRR